MKRSAYNIAHEHLDTYLKEHSMRPSAVRDFVLERICMLSQPFTATQLEEACQAERISTGTVYNSLNLFLKANILHAIERQRGKKATEYELITNQTRMQIVCMKCGRATSFSDKVVKRLLEERKFTNFNMQNFSLIVYGECKICRKKLTKDNEK